MKTAKQLKITLLEMEAAQWFIQQVLAGKIHTKKKLTDRQEGDQQFNMEHSLRETCSILHRCGTTGCIGGWMSLYMHNKNPSKYGKGAIASMSPALQPLFYPKSARAWRASALGGAVATAKFLETGKPPTGW